MSYAASTLTQALVRKLNGKCHISLASGKSMSFGAQILAEFTSCLSCKDECDHSRAIGVEGKSLSITVDARPDGMRLRWKCPKCSAEVVEVTSILGVKNHSAVIEEDPLCFSCRKSEQLDQISAKIDE